MLFINEKYLRFFCDEIKRGCGILPKLIRAEPPAAIYPQEALSNVQSALSGKDFSLQTVTGGLVAAGKLRAVRVTSQQKGLFLNANELADLQRCTRER